MGHPAARTLRFHSAGLWWISWLRNTYGVPSCINPRGFRLLARNPEMLYRRRPWVPELPENPHPLKLPPCNDFRNLLVLLEPLLFDALFPSFNPYSSSTPPLPFSFHPFHSMVVNSQKSHCLFSKIRMSTVSTKKSLYLHSITPFWAFNFFQPMVYFPLYLVHLKGTVQWDLIPVRNE